MIILPLKKSRERRLQSKDTCSKEAIQEGLERCKIPTWETQKSHFHSETKSYSVDGLLLLQRDQSVIHTKTR